MNNTYKNTEIGYIPNDWEVKRLGGIGYFKNGINKSSENFGFGYPFVNLLDVFGKKKISSNSNFGLININEIEKNTYNLKKGDVLFVRSSVKPDGVGLTCVINENLESTVFSGFIIRFRDNDVLSLGFKEHCFYANYFRNNLIAKSSVSANTNINQEALKNLFIVIPPLPEQILISEILSDTDQLIENLEELIQKKKMLKQATMHALLTPKKHWEVKKLGEIATFYSGGTPLTTEKKYYFGTIPFIKSGEINSKETEQSITLEGLRNSSSKMVDVGDILYALYGATSGEIAISKIKGAINQAILCIKSSENHYYLYYYLKLKKENIIKTYLQGGQGNLSSQIIKKIKISIPPLSEQIAISTILSDMDTEIEALTTKYEKYKQIRQGLMHELLTGKTRLV